jgi:hypothetical protein
VRSNDCAGCADARKARPHAKSAKETFHALFFEISGGLTQATRDGLVVIVTKASVRHYSLKKTAVVLTLASLPITPRVARRSSGMPPMTCARCTSRRQRVSGFGLRCVQTSRLRTGFTRRGCCSVNAGSLATRCQRGLEALMHYRWEFNSRLNEFKATPVHDWSSNAADAFRYLAVRQRTPEPQAEHVPRYQPGPWSWS